VLNAGVFGYGLDQTVLRAESLVDKYHPDVLVLSFIHDDVARCALSARMNVYKPYFENHDGSLALFNQPVPPPAIDYSVGPLRRALGYSLLAHTLMLRIAPEWWLTGINQFETSVATGQDAQGLACLLMDRLNRLATSRKLRVIVMSEYWQNISSEEEQVVDAVTRCINRQQVEVLDLRGSLERLRNEYPQQFQNFYTRSRHPHMSAAGNKFVAEQLDQFIRNGSY
jgi:hypothetical protein